jgi:hypothetical protein
MNLRRLSVLLITVAISIKSALAQDNPPLPTEASDFKESEKHHIINEVDDKHHDSMMASEADVENPSEAKEILESDEELTGNTDVEEPSDAQAAGDLTDSAAGIVSNIAPEIESQENLDTEDALDVGESAALEVEERIAAEIDKDQASKVDVGEKEEICDCKESIDLEIVSLTSELNDLRTKLSAYEQSGELAKLSDSVNSCSIQLDEITTTINNSETSPEVSTLELELKELQSVVSTLEDLEEELEDTYHAINVFKDRAEERRKGLGSALKEYTDKKEEIQDYVLQHTIEIGKLQVEMEEILLKPEPMVNTVKIRNDFQKFWKSLFARSKKEN